MTETPFAHVEFGLDTFGDATVDEAGTPLSHAQVLRNEEARDIAWPHFQAMHASIGRERGWPPMQRAQFDMECGPDGAMFVGSPETVAQKLAKTVAGLGLSRFDLKYSLGTLSHEHLMECIRLYGTEVIPRTRELLALEYAPTLA